MYSLENYKLLKIIYGNLCMICSLNLHFLQNVLHCLDSLLLYSSRMTRFVRYFFFLVNGKNSVLHAHVNLYFQAKNLFGSSGGLHDIPLPPKAMNKQNINFETTDLIITSHSTQTVIYLSNWLTTHDRFYHITNQ